MIWKPRCPRPVCESRRGREKSTVEPPRQPQHDDAERAPHDVGRAEGREGVCERVVVRPVDLDVEVGARPSEQQGIAHASADEKRAREHFVRIEHALERARHGDREWFPNER